MQFKKIPDRIYLAHGSDLLLKVEEPEVVDFEFTDHVEEIFCPDDLPKPAEGVTFYRLNPVHVAKALAWLDAKADTGSWASLAFSIFGRMDATLLYEHSDRPLLEALTRAELLTEPHLHQLVQVWQTKTQKNEKP